MRRILALVLRVASVPVGVGVGLWTAQIPWNCPVFSCPINVPQFATWQCALFGAGAAVALLALSFADSLTNALRVLSVPVGVSVGLWTAEMTSPLPFSGNCGGLPCPVGLLQTTRFATWQCASFGAAAGIIVLLLSFAVTRLPRAEHLKAA
jgi:hypothetical protein